MELYRGRSDCIAMNDFGRGVLRIYPMRWDSNVTPPKSSELMALRWTYTFEVALGRLSQRSRAQTINSLIRIQKY
jgi:hypothetical protein